MSSVRWYHMALMLMLVPRPSFAIQLHWISGSSDLAFASAVRCTLVVQAEGRLPPSWRLIWVASGDTIQPLALDPLAACLGDIAQVAAVVPPATPADSAEHTTVALLCSAPTGVASTAFYLLDLPADASGKLKVVALDPTDLDSSRVIESNEVTYNGGIDGDYPSVTLAASSSHAANQFVIHAAGTGLSEVVEAIAQAPDSLWSLPLQITGKTDSTLTAMAEVYASMPASVLRLTSESGTVTVAPLAPDGLRDGVDPNFEALADSCRLHHCYYFDPDPNVQPRDFAFFYAIAPNPVRGLFHLFYIRNHKNAPPGSTTRSFGHAWSRDLRNWEADTSAAVFSVSSNAWDRAHVWAPSIVQVGPDYQMFYTGVDDQVQLPDVVYGNQRIGYATTAAIDIGHATVWNRRSEPTYTVNRTGWARRDSIPTQPHRQQFRDPFIREDPDSAGRYLLFMVGDKLDGDYAVGVARNAPGTLDVWRDLGYYRCTDRDYSGDGQIVESVTAFPDSAYPVSKTSAQATWRLVFTHGVNSPDDQTMRFSTKALNTLLGDTTLVDSTGLVHWSTPATNLFTYLNGDSTAWGTYATEYLRAGGVDFLATYDGTTGILVSRMLWNGTDFYLRQPEVTDVGADGGGGKADVAMRLARAVPGAGRIGFAIQLPARQRVKLGIYDVAGRRVRSLIDGELPPGTIPLDWDGKDEAGSSVRTGMYFARLSGDFGRRIVRAAFIR